MNIAQAKCIPIADYLARAGHQPSKTRQGGRELWYHSPVRDGDENPSFKVDTLKNVWFDHGVAQGGNIIDLVRELCACDVRDALRHLEGTGLYSPALAVPVTSRRSGTAPSTRSAHAARAPEGESAAGEKEKSTAFELVGQGPLRHPALLQYLDKRGIDHDVAREYLSQIDFKGPQSGGTYFALGYPAGGGFEARNALFKGFVGTGKAVSFHDVADASRLLVFEGFLDFLTYVTLQKRKKAAQRPAESASDAIVVLNSTNLWPRALPYLDDPRFASVQLYLDNDAAGDAATRKLIEAAADNTRLSDMRGHYAGHDDLNAWYLAQSPDRST